MDSSTVQETRNHYPVEVKVAPASRDDVRSYPAQYETFCDGCGEHWPCRAAKVPHVPDGTCYACGQRIVVQVFMGDLWCSDDCRKLYDKEFGEWDSASTSQ